MPFGRVEALEPEFLERPESMPQLQHNRLSRKLRMKQCGACKFDVRTVRSLAVEIKQAHHRIVSVENAYPASSKMVYLAHNMKRVRRDGSF